jgi:hypothetical protein
MSHDLATTGLTAGTNYTTIGENEANSSNQCHHAVFRLVTTAQAYTVTIDAASASLSTSAGWAMQTYAFKESTGGAAAKKVAFAPLLARRLILP